MQTIQKFWNGITTITMMQTFIMSTTINIMHRIVHFSALVITHGDWRPRRRTLEKYGYFDVENGDSFNRILYEIWQDGKFIGHIYSAPKGAIFMMDKTAKIEFRKRGE